MDTQSIINCLETLRDKMTPEQIARLEALKESTKQAGEVIDENIK
jgi:hypothetical protein